MSKIEVSFKQIPADMLFPFLEMLKKACIQRMDELVEDNYMSLPYRNQFQKENFPRFWSELSLEQEMQAIRWAAKSLFCFGWYYDSSSSLLSMTILHETGNLQALHDLFDKTIVFDDDNVYEYTADDWKGIEAFERIYKHWHEMSDTEVESIAGRELTKEGQKNQRNYSIYREIWTHYVQEIINKRMNVAPFYSSNDSSVTMFCVKCHARMYKSLQE